MANALLDVVDTFDSLDKQYNLLRLACKTQSDRDDLDEQYAAAQRHVEEVTGEELEDDNAEVAALSTSLKACNEELSKAVSEMGNMSKVLDNLTKAVGLGAELIALLA